MNQTQELEVLRDKLIARRRSIVDSLWRVAPEHLTGDGIAKIQDAIDAVNRALSQEMRAEATYEIEDAVDRIRATSR
jgi:hypothetical protein